MKNEQRDAVKLDEDTRSRIDDLARQVRRDTVRSIAHAGNGHPGGALGAADIFAVLYGHVMKHSPEKRNDPSRDRFVLSNGHICAAFYAVLARSGYFSPAELAGLRKIGGMLQGHPARHHMPEMVETSSGPLGQGLSVANGLALAARLNGLPSRTFCLMGDGELQEGQVWEALMTAAHYQLSNMTLIISYNGLQIDGEVDRVMNLKPVAGKLEAFGFAVQEIDGHNINAIVDALAAAQSETKRPTAILAHTVMGKGVPFMEDRAEWHGGKLSWEQAETALAALGEAHAYEDFAGVDGRGAGR